MQDTPLNPSHAPSARSRSWRAHRHALAHSCPGILRRGGFETRSPQKSLSMMAFLSDAAQLAISIKVTAITARPPPRPRGGIDAIGKPHALRFETCSRNFGGPRGNRTMASCRTPVLLAAGMFYLLSCTSSLQAQNSCDCHSMLSCATCQRTSPLPLSTSSSFVATGVARLRGGSENRNAPDDSQAEEDPRGDRPRLSSGSASPPPEMDSGTPEPRDPAIDPVTPWPEGAVRSPPPESPEPEDGNARPRDPALDPPSPPPRDGEGTNAASVAPARGIVGVQQRLARLARSAYVSPLDTGLVWCAVLALGIAAAGVLVGTAGDADVVFSTKVR